jgi:phosphatidylglycerophosphatase GEP4
MSRQLINVDGLKVLFDAIRHRHTMLRARTELRSVALLDAESLRAQFKIRAIVFDVDNTLTAPYAAGAPNGSVGDEVRRALRRCEAVFGADRVALLSNHAGSADDVGHVRAGLLEQSLGAPVLRRRSGVQKPSAALGELILAHFRHEVTFAEVALVGDRRLTDVYFANRLGMHALLVPPLDAAAEPFMVRLARRFENAICK